MSETYPYYYSRQFESYIEQFLRIFSGFQTKDSDGNYYKIPVVYGNMQRIVSSVLQNRNTFQGQKLPLLAGNIESIEPLQEKQKPKHFVDTVVYHDSEGVKRATQRLIGPAFRFNATLSIYASSMDELFQILEQILLIFNPRITIQKSDDVFDSNYLTEVELENISSEINNPIGSDTRVVMMSLSFSFDGRINYPNLNQDGIIEKIIGNVFDDSIVPEGIHVGDFEVTDNGE